MLMNLGDGTYLLGSSGDDGEHTMPLTQELSSAADTPIPTDSDDQRGGPITRVTNEFAALPAHTLRRLILSGSESADAIRTRRDELYRNAFPRIEPRYEQRCDECGTEFDTDVTECAVCGATALSPPDPQKKREAKRLFESVNPAGQSLRDLAKRCEEDQWAGPGVSTIVVEHEYQQATDGALYREGAIYREEPTALHYADPLALKPVVDEHGQPGNHWWVCPIHRDEHYDQGGRCDCGAELRPVHFVEGRRNEGYRYYLRQEVITWSYAHPRLHGLDGISPGAHIWLKQAILMMMDRYGGSYYNTDNDRLPNKFYIFNTPNKEQFEAELAKARDGDDEYKSPIISSSVDPENVDIMEIDGMPDELLGQSEAMKSQFKSDIRQAFGISDVHDSDLEDAGGLNNEGLQLEVVDRSLASQMHDYREGWLDTLMKRLGFDGWRISFLPERGADADTLKQNLKTAAFVKQAGGDAEIVDGELQVSDFEVELDDSDDPPSLTGAQDLPGVGNPFPDAGGDPSQLQALRQELDALEQATFQILAPDAISQKGQPVYSEADDVPANVQNRISQAVRQHDFSPVESVSSATLQSIFEERLTQPQGWSIDSLAGHLQQESTLAADRARSVARTEATAILNAAREDAAGTLAKETDEQVLHYWDGPQDGSTSVMCAWLKGGDDLTPADAPSTGFAGTNPEYGGTPVPMDELRDLQREALDTFTDEGGSSAAARDHVLHTNERHTHRAVLDSEVT